MDFEHILRTLVDRLQGKQDAPNGVTVHVFRETWFSADSHTVVCIAIEKSVQRFISRKELDHAFSGFVKYGDIFGHRYLGVWGNRNASRFRRFLRERGADLTIDYSKPKHARVAMGKTASKRSKVRQLE